MFQLRELFFPLILILLFQGPVEEPKKVHNTHLLIDSSGEIQAIYRKTHLFDVDIKGGAILNESEYVIAGQEIAKPVQTPVGKIGLQIVSFYCLLHSLARIKMQIISIFKPH